MVFPLRPKTTKIRHEQSTSKTRYEKAERHNTAQERRGKETVATEHDGRVLVSRRCAYRERHQKSYE